jgi:ferredoxin
MKVTVDQPLCMATGRCSQKVPEVFDQDDAGCVVLLEPHPRPELEREVALAAEHCPSQCIHIED